MKKLRQLIAALVLLAIVGAVVWFLAFMWLFNSLPH